MTSDLSLYCLHMPHKQDAKCMLTVYELLYICILGQVWHLIGSIPDLCTLTYFSIHAELFNESRGIKFGLFLYLYQYFFLHASSEGSQVRLCGCACSPEPLLLALEISTKVQYNGSCGPRRDKTCLRGF